MPRPRPVTPTAAASGRARCLTGGGAHGANRANTANGANRARGANRASGARGAGRAAVAVVLALALAPGGARASVQTPAPAPELSPRPGDVSAGTGEMSAGTGEMSEGPGAAATDLAGDAATVQAVPDPAGDEATRQTALAQQARARGDLDGAIAGWQRALATLPVTQATAHRRAELSLAIAAAHAEAATARADPQRLRAAIATLDAYLAGLDPTDDENRVAVEQRRAELGARRVDAPGATRPATADPRDDHRRTIAGGLALGLGVGGGGALLVAGLVTGGRADAQLAAAVARPAYDPTREADKAAALARGVRGNRMAIAGGVLGGALLLAGVTLLILGARRPARRARLGVGPGGLAWRF